MKKTLQDQYLLIKEGKGHKGVFLTEAKRQFPNIVRNAATFEEAASSLKTKNIISENVIGLTAINSIFEPKKKESYEVAYEAFLAEVKKKENEDEKVKAEEKKVSKKVEEDASHNFDNKDDKNIDNLIFDQVMTGYYAEMKDPKNADKTMQELKDIVMKNLQKDPIFYTKDGQFGVKDLGYTMDAPGLGEPKEAKGKWKASGYGDLKEGQVDMNKSYPTIKNNGTKIEYKGKPGTISGNFMVGGEEFASYKVKFDDDTTDEISTADKNIKFLEESLEESKLRKVIREMISEELNTEEFKNTLFKLEQPYLNDKEALGDIQKIYSSHIQGLNSISQNLKESVEKELAAINKEAEYEIISSKLEKVQALIDKKQSQISRLDEDEDLKDLTDKKKVKEISKDIKALEKAKAKLEKIMNKGKGKTKLPKKEVIDEMDMEPSEEYMAAKEDAESRYEEGEEIDSIISTYHNLSFEDRNLLRQDLEGKMDGMDY